MHKSAFEYVKPTEAMTKQMDAVRDAAQAFTDVIERELPDGADKAYVLRRHRTTVFWAMTAIIRQPDGSPR